MGLERHEDDDRIFRFTENYHFNTPSYWCALAVNGQLYKKTDVQISKWREVEWKNKGM